MKKQTDEHEMRVGIAKRRIPRYEGTETHAADYAEANHPYASFGRVAEMRIRQKRDTSSSAIEGLEKAVAQLISASRISFDKRREKMHGIIASMHEICFYLSKIGDVDHPEVAEILLPAYELHSRSPFVKRLQEWPRGYAGDFEAIEYLVKGKPRIPEEDNAFWIEWYALNTPMAYQHRNKLLFQRDSCISAARYGECRVLSVGCGGAYDLYMLRNQNNIKFHFWLIDIEKDAVTLAEQRLSWAASVTSLVGDAITKIRATKGPYDIIIFGGLFDYLNERTINILLRQSFVKLAESGRLVFTNVSDFSNFDIFLERLARWKMIYRSASDLRSLVESSGIGFHSLFVEQDATGLASLCTIKKLNS